MQDVKAQITVLDEIHTWNSAFSMKIASALMISMMSKEARLLRDCTMIRMTLHVVPEAGKIAVWDRDEVRVQRYNRSP